MTSEVEPRMSSFYRVKAAIEAVEPEGENLIYADECLFNQKHVFKTAWFNKRVNITP